jgi:NADPH:quinone reductase-like Zn-dependent oxidoreductase
MRAILYNAYGDPEVLQLGEVAPPQADSRRVRIDVAFAGVNPIDWRMRRGEMRWVLPGGFPRIPGFDVAGTVSAAPSDSGFQPGDRVLALLDTVRGGGYAEQASCAPRAMARLPEGIDWDVAAALPLAGSTALQSLRDHGRLRAGQRVAITGASGGVGSLAVQIAKAYGAHVTAVARGTQRDFVTSLGADAFVDYREEDFTEAAEPFDLVFDAAAATSFFAARRCLTPRGHYVSTEPSAAGGALSLLTKVLPGRRCRVMLVQSRTADLRELVELIEQGKLRVVIDRTFPLAEAAEAHREGERGGRAGKLVLRVAET